MDNLHYALIAVIFVITISHLLESSKYRREQRKYGICLHERNQFRGWWIESSKKAGIYFDKLMKYKLDRLPNGRFKKRDE